MDGIEAIVQQLEAQKAAIDRALEALREVAESEGTPTAGKAVKRAARKKRTSGLSAAGRKRLSENMKRRWAAKHAAMGKAKRAAKKKAA